MTDRNVIPIRHGVTPEPPCGEMNAAVVDMLTELLEQAKTGQVTGVAFATLHPGDLSTYGTRGRTTRGLLGALALLQHEMCSADMDNG
jgi:hypothetical protein